MEVFVFKEGVNFMINNKIVIWGMKRMSGMNNFRKCIVNRNKWWSM